jgi:hypothetical protein
MSNTSASTAATQATPASPVEVGHLPNWLRLGCRLEGRTTSHHGYGTVRVILFPPAWWKAERKRPATNGGVPCR